MRIKYGALDVEALKPTDLTGHLSDLASLQREMKWTMTEVQAMSRLEVPALAMSVFLSFRSVGRLISYAKAEQLLDEVEFVPEPGDMPDVPPADGQAEGEAEDPTSAPTDSARGDIADPAPEQVSLP